MGCDFLCWLICCKYLGCQSQWPCCLRCRFTAARLLRLWIRILQGGMSVCLSVWCECCVLSGRGLCIELITRPEESYRLWCVAVCDLETSRMRRPWPTLGHSATGGRKKIYIYIYLGYNVPFSADKLHLIFIIPQKVGICCDVWCYSAEHIRSVQTEL